MRVRVTERDSSEIRADSWISLFCKDPSLCRFVDETKPSAKHVRIYIENAQDLDPTPLRCLLERVRSDKIGVCLDIGHIHYSHAPVSRWFEELGDRIGYLHLSDNLGEFDDHLPLGKGSIDWELVNSLWKSLGKNIPITLETGNLDSTQESLQFLRNHQYFGLEG